MQRDTLHVFWVDTNFFYYRQKNTILRHNNEPDIKMCIIHISRFSHKLIHFPCYVNSKGIESK